MAEYDICLILLLLYKIVYIYIYEFSYDFDTVLDQFLETGTSDRCLIYIVQRLRLSGFLLYPFHFSFTFPLIKIKLKQKVSSLNWYIRRRSLINLIFTFLAVINQNYRNYEVAKSKQWFRETLTLTLTV